MEVAGGDPLRPHCRAPARLTVAAPAESACPGDGRPRPIDPGGEAGCLDVLQGRLGYRFTDVRLLEKALTHAGAGAGVNYDRLEFLGDRVLGLVVADELLRCHGDEDVGGLALRYNALVRREACARAASDAGLADFVRLAGSERAAGTAVKPSILADVAEAAIAALYLDGGLESARAFVHRYWISADPDRAPALKDGKTRLQECAHRMSLPAPDYRLVATDGPAHAPVFRIRVDVGPGLVGSGRGASKRAAEQDAAAALLRILDPT